MEGKKLLQSIRLENILSFGPDTPAFPLEPLNVLIGPNASGKSNLIEALSILQAAPSDVQKPTREGGGVSHWLWKGVAPPPAATVDVIADYLHNSWPLRYRLSFTETGARFDLKGESVEIMLLARVDNTSQFLRYRYQGDSPVVNVKGDDNSIQYLKREDLRFDQSILSQLREPDTYPEITYLARAFESMSFYREWNFGRFTPPRLPQQPDLQQDRLLEDASNLGVVLSDIMNRPGVKDRIVERMRDFYPAFRDVNATVGGGTVQIFFHEDGLQHAIPATRLSDGSLRYLCLLAVLCHPNPPPVICIEEPEVGLHPDIIPEVAKLLVEASQRSQLFVTTHSDVLVDALSETPEAVIVCEKVDGATQLRRLRAEELVPWLEEYRLGEIWSSGRIGGNRW